MGAWFMGAHGVVLFTMFLVIIAIITIYNTQKKRTILFIVIIIVIAHKKAFQRAESRGAQPPQDVKTHTHSSHRST